MARARGGGCGCRERLTLAEREDIAYLRGHDLGGRQIAVRIGRDPGDGVAGAAPQRLAVAAALPALSAHIQAAAGRGGAGRASWSRAARCARVVRAAAAGLLAGADRGRLKRDYPGRPELQVSHETIYQALFVQGKGSLRAEVAAALRCGRARRRRPAPAAPEARGKIPGMINISERPARPPTGRCRPWEGDLIIGAGVQSAVATLASAPPATA